jgi:mxaA protein
MARLVLLVAGCTSAVPARPADDPVVSREEPRPFGYAIGDVIRHRLTIEPKPGSVLDDTSLPKPGPVNRWLELRQVEARPGPRGGYRVDLEYQAFYAPLAVKSLTIPGFVLHFKGPAGASDVEVPSWPFRMAPIHGLAVLEEGGLEPLRPDAVAEPPDPAAARTRFGGFMLAALVSLAYLGYARGILGFGRQGRHFREARRELHRLRAGGPGSPAVLRAGFTCVHRAFDRTLGEPLFAERLPEFFDGRAGYAALRGEIEGFFRASYGLFFGDGTAPEGFGLERLEALCLACLRVERNRS